MLSRHYAIVAFLVIATVMLTSLQGSSAVYSQDPYEVQWSDEINTSEVPDCWVVAELWCCRDGGHTPHLITHALDFNKRLVIFRTGSTRDSADTKVKKAFEDLKEQILADTIRIAIDLGPCDPDFDGEDASKWKITMRKQFHCSGEKWNQVRPIQTKDGRIMVFGTTENKMHYVVQESPNAGWTDIWKSPWQKKEILQTVSASNQSGTIEVFVIGDRTLYRTFQEQRDGAFTSWTNNNNLWADKKIRAMALGVNQDGRLELFAVGAGGKLIHAYQREVNTAWSGWDDEGEIWDSVSIRDELAVATNSDGQLEVFAINDGGKLVHTTQRREGGWNDWQSEEVWNGRSLNRVAAANKTNGLIEVFAITKDRELIHTVQRTGAEGGGWNAWQDEGENWGSRGVSQISLATNSDGRIEVFAISGDLLYHTYQGQQGWSGWHKEYEWQDRALKYIAAINNQDGRIEVIGVDDENSVLHSYQAGEGGWVGWQFFAGYSNRAEYQPFPSPTRRSRGCRR